MVDGWSAYFFKAVLDMLSLTLQQEQDIMDTNVKVCALSLGVVYKAMQSYIRETDASQFRQLQRFKELKESGELLKLEEVVRQVINYVLKPDSDMPCVFRLL